LTHTLSNRAFYTLNASTFYKRNETNAFDTVEEYGNNTFLQQTPEFVFTDFDPVSGAPTDSVRVLQGPGRFLRGGIDPDRFQRETRNVALKGDLTWQALDEHLVKMGVEVRQDDLFLESFALIVGDDGTLQVPGRETNEFQLIEDVRPLTVSAYIQDKAEYESFVINAGLRFDYFNSNGVIPADPEDPNVFNPQKRINRFNDLDGDGVISEAEERDDNRTTLEQRLEYFYNDAEAKYQISPRLGIAYPVTASGVIHFSYGYFFQIPTYEFLFANPGYRVGNTSGTYGPFGNPNLDPQRTVMYEIGLQQGFGDDFLLDVTGFYRDIEDWVSVGFPTEATLPGVDYLIYENLDFSNVRGITLALGKRFNGRFSFDVDYTFQTAEGSNSDPNDAIAARNGSGDPALRIIPLGWDQRHTLNANVFLGGNGWGASAIGRFGTGYPYTPARDADGDRIGTLPAVPTNALRRPATASVDLYAFREFSLGAVTPRVFVQVFNLLDARNANGVFGDTGLPDVTFLNVGATDDPGFYVRPDFYQEPRRIQLGLSVGF
ncbi:MAG: TonB-dependent receptor, partial [Bacteroidota bacterium]